MGALAGRARREFCGSPQGGAQAGETRLLYSRMTRRITATITVEGDEALLAGYRRRVNELLDAELGEPYRELHAPGRLDYRLKADGVPYPVFVTASGEFPQLVVEVQWEYPGGAASGRATIQAGRLTQQSTAAGPGEPAAGAARRGDRGGPPPKTPPGGRPGRAGGECRAAGRPGRHARDRGRLPTPEQGGVD